MGEAFDGFMDGLNAIAAGFNEGVAEIVSNGADEMAQALFTGNGYTGAEWSPPEPEVAGYEETLIIDNAPFEAAAIEAPVIDAPAMDAGWGEQAPMGFPEIGYSDNATVIDMQPQIEAASFDQMLDNYAAIAPPQQDMDLGMER